MDRVRRQAPATLTAPVTARPDVVMGRHVEEDRTADRPAPPVAAFLIARWLGLSSQGGERVKADQSVVLTEQAAQRAGVARRARAG